MEKEVIRCRLCGREVEVFVSKNEIVDVGEVIKEGIIGCPHEYE